MPAFVITVNKSLAQTFDRVRVFIPEAAVAAYGQLCVAFHN